MKDKVKISIARSVIGLAFMCLSYCIIDNPPIFWGVLVALFANNIGRGNQ